MDPDPAAGDEAPRWLTYKCSACGARVYSGYTSTALERMLAGESLVKPDFFHADCATETTLDEAALQFDDGTPWTPPAPGAGQPADASRST